MRMKYILSIAFLYFTSSMYAQEPFKELGLDNEVDLITLNNGRYIEHFENDTLRQIGSVMFNMIKNKVEYIIPKDDLEKIKITKRNREVSRFFSIDPIAKDFPWNSPYAFSENQVIHAIELEGLETSNDLNYRDPSVQKMTPEQKQSFNSGQRQAGAAALAVAVDVFVTKGWLSKTFFLHELGSEMNATDKYNEAKANGNTQEAAKQQERMKAHGLTTTLGAVGEVGGYFIAKGMSAIQKAGIRKQLASDFYKQSGYTGARAESHMSGIDFSKPVSTVTLKKGTEVQQWVGSDGKIGNYFSPVGTDPTKIGIDINAKGGSLKTFTLTEDVKVLKSVTGDFQGNKGGGTQYFSTALKENIK